MRLSENGSTNQEPRYGQVSATELWDDISPAPYKELAELAKTITTKLHSAAWGGKAFMDCTLYKHSEKARAIACLKECKQAQKLIDMKKEVA